MKTKLTKKVLSVLLCCWLVQSTVQAGIYTAGQSIQQSPAFGAKLSAQELQQLVAPIAMYPDGRMTGGFAFVAYPAEYRFSGVMTLIVNESGTIYEKDLGPNTTRIAEAMTVYDPNSTWHRVE